MQPHLKRCFDGITSLKFEVAVSDGAGESKAKTRRGSKLWDRLRGPAGGNDVAARQEQRRSTWRMSLLRSSSTEALRTPDGPLGPDTSATEPELTNLQMLAALGSSDKTMTMAQASMALMLSNTMKRSRAPKAAELDIVAMMSSSGETVPLVAIVSPRQHKYVLEAWMGEVEIAMKASVKSQLMRCIQDDKRVFDLPRWIDVSVAG